MPIYDYRCANCSLTISKKQYIDHRDDPQPCEICQQPMFRVMATPAIRFKGSGFYSTDSKVSDETL